jgi:anti-sigma-K factor RskA
MDIRTNPGLQDRLAAEYVLGTLRGPARDRFQRMMSLDSNLRIAVEAWQSRLVPIAVAIEPVKPRGRVWDAILRRTAPGAMATTPGGLWNSLALWRSIGLAASGATTALLAALIVFAPDSPKPAAPPQIVRVPASELPAAYFAVLSDPKSQKPVLAVSAIRNSDRLVVKMLDASIAVPGKSLELWALPPGGTPRSLGLVATREKDTLRLKTVADQSVGDAAVLAISLEPSGGSPTASPTGPVLYSGPCVKIW